MPSIEVERIVARFLDSWEARGVGLPVTDLRRAALLLVGSALDDLGVEPRLLDDQQLGDVLWLTARKFGRGDPLAKDGGKVIRAFFAHLRDVELVPNGYELERALADVEANFARLVASVADEQRIAGETKPLVNRAAKLGRNDPCPCGSGKKFKQCCGRQ
jgi:SEC-C motif